MKRAVLAAAVLGALIIFLRQRPAPRPSPQTELPPPAPSRPASSTSSRELSAGRPPAALAAASKPLVPRAADTPAPAETAQSAPTTKEDILDDIVRSGNDNDPRLDSDFNDLSPETKHIFRRKYRRLPPENLNERGTIVYLLGKNLVSTEDWAFLRELVVEPPCLSLGDCSKEASPTAAHDDPGGAVALAYPALVALKQAQFVLESAYSGNAARREALAVVQAAKGSLVPIVARTASELERKF